MSRASDQPPSSERQALLGQLPPAMRTRAPGPESLAWLRRLRQAGAPMGSREPVDVADDVSDVSAPRIVHARARGDNVVDVDGNRYVDFAAGFGSMLLGHGEAAALAALEAQAGQLVQALGDLHPSDVKIRLLERLGELYPEAGAQVIVGQSGADAIGAALKTAVLFTGKSGVIAFEGCYHGLSHGPLAACGLRASYRRPFAAQLNPDVSFEPYPLEDALVDRALEAVRARLSGGSVGAVLFEPIAGRAGCLVPAPRFATELAELCRESGALLIADEIWTGLGRAGHWLRSTGLGIRPDLLCLGKGLGGGLPISACIGSARVMAGWSRDDEVVHTSTFAGAPLACATALSTLDSLEGRALVRRSRVLGARLRDAFAELAAAPGSRLARLNGAGLMLGLELDLPPGGALGVYRSLLNSGYLVSLGGAGRESVVLTPPLTISDAHFAGLVEAVERALSEAPA